MKEEEIYNKWKPFLDSFTVSNCTWGHPENNDMIDNLSKNTLAATSSYDFSLFPVAMKLATQTIGLDLIPVQPIDCETEEQRIARESKIREDKLDAIINDKEFVWKDEYNPKGIKVDLMYMDFKYGTSSSIPQKKTKKKRK